MHLTIVYYYILNKLNRQMMIKVIREVIKLALFQYAGVHIQQ